MSLDNIRLNQLKIVQYTNDSCLDYVCTISISLPELIAVLRKNETRYFSLLARLLSDCIVKVFSDTFNHRKAHQKKTKILIQTLEGEFLLDLYLRQGVELPIIAFSRHLRKHNAFNGLSIDFSGNFKPEELGALSSTHFISVSGLQFNAAFRNALFTSHTLLNLHKAFDKAIVYRGEIDLSYSSELLSERLEPTYENFYRCESYQSLIELHHQLRTFNAKCTLIYSNDWIRRSQF